MEIQFRGDWSELYSFRNPKWTTLQIKICIGAWFINSEILGFSRSGIVKVIMNVECLYDKIIFSCCV